MSILSTLKTYDDVKPYLDDNSELVIPLCEDILHSQEICLDPYEKECIPFDKDQATVVGFFSKQHGLFRSFIEACKNDDFRMAFLLQRISYEIFVKMQYLIKYGSDAQKEYRLCSYTNRYKYYKVHNGESGVPNIAIQKFLEDIKDDGFTLDDIKDVVDNHKKNFGGKNVAALMSEFEDKSLYDPLYGYSSDAIHSDWGEIRQIYLSKTKDNQYVYCPEDKKHIHYRFIIQFTEINIESCLHYIEWLSTIDIQPSIFKTIKERIIEVDRIFCLIMDMVIEEYSTDKYMYE